MKKKAIIIFLVIIAVLSIGSYFFLRVNNSSTAYIYPYQHPTTLIPDEYGWYEVQIPSLLLGEETAYQFVSDMAYEHSMFYELFRGVEYYITSDGDLILYFYDEWLDFGRRTFYYTILMFCPVTNPYLFFHSPIKNITFENRLLTEITVLVEVQYFYNTPVFPIVTFINVSISLWAGYFQLLSGVPADEWGVTITVLCYDTGELVSQETFPHEGMFDREW